MSTFDHSKYPAFKPLQMSARRWPDQTINAAPTWCSVDLRDGNQALIEPMTTAQKSRLYDQLIKIGFKEIEVGFPSASSHDFDFVRDLIDNNRIPEDVTIQVLTQARPELIKKTFEALKGVRRAVLHVYNSTSTVQREKVFGLDRDGITDIAVRGAQMVKDYAAKYPETEWVFEYSPESFTGTEIDFAIDVCNAVIDVWQPTPEHKAIMNLPSTVEMATPNIYADQIETFCDRINRRDSILISTHTHNDRGCAVAAAELGVMAGADRVEGTLMGNGERTGNMDIVTMAMNLYSQGIDPKLDFGPMDEIIQTYKDCTQMPLHPRHPYAGELVFTAFSGSHQDAIKKCLDKRDDSQPWEVAYLPIDPADIGRSYQEVVRINSQSGKGGIAYVLERDYGLQLPRWLQIDFSGAVQRHAEKSKAEVAPDAIWELFQATYFTAAGPWTLGNYQVNREDGSDKLQAELIKAGVTHSLSGSGAGVVESFVNAMEQFVGKQIVLVEYSEHALSQSADAEAICYIQMNIDGHRVCGVGRSADIIQASLDAILGAINVAARQSEEQAA
ncbi:2-isopropylmalate synthase [Halieaceae bacterium IMCC14734]|uniref:2-isopropylmalate synthase n=1 Tax=Candidatus Litorirhabdus singularis TaxID=2518993 RepID=A0ABT3TJ23_9GAMM|nr:2-isopropylmalate synthase [Candidatus Litorirhabdus singularis]MCX2982312.1 2-isopropylmalate synthase [Candidatus Litorirhabdus singularis]